jgi:hypothetical protein
MSIFDNELLRKTTQMVIEEYVQDYPQLRLTKDSLSADIYVYPQFLEYERPDVGMNLSVFSMRTERVYLKMGFVFEHRKYHFYQNLVSKEMLEKEVRSNFYTMVETQMDFAESMLFNLIKKTIDKSFIPYLGLLF